MSNNHFLSFSETFSETNRCLTLLFHKSPIFVDEMAKTLIIVEMSVFKMILWFCTKMNHNLDVAA